MVRWCIALPEPLRVALSREPLTVQNELAQVPGLHQFDL